MYIVAVCPSYLYYCVCQAVRCASVCLCVICLFAIFCCHVDLLSCVFKGLL